jgi:hypothetical protein
MFFQGERRVGARLGAVVALVGGVSAGLAGSPSAQAADEPWLIRDSSTIAPADALYLLAGSLYGDPSGSKDANEHLHYISGVANHLTRPTANVETLEQALAAVQAIGGSGEISAKSATKSRLEFFLPAGASIELDLAGLVLVNGVDAFGLSADSGGWTTTATGSQVRAFLAGFMQGEGNHDGQVGDDPTAAHLAFVQDLMATPQAYAVPTDLTGRNFFRLYVHDPADYPRVQAYPFIVYGRCPGGRPR